MIPLLNKGCTFAIFIDLGTIDLASVILNIIMGCSLMVYMRLLSNLLLIWSSQKLLYLFNDSVMLVISISVVAPNTRLLVLCFLQIISK